MVSWFVFILVLDMTVELWNLGTWDLKVMVGMEVCMLCLFKI